MSFEKSRDRARAQDRDDPLSFTRAEFNIPTKAQIASTRLGEKCLSFPKDPSSPIG